MSLFIGLFIFLMVGLFIEAVANEYKINQKHKIKSKILEHKAKIQEIEAKNQKLKDERAFREQKKRIILKQIESGTRPNYDLIIKKIFIILGFISLSVLISFLILKN